MCSLSPPARFAECHSAFARPALRADSIDVTAFAATLLACDGQQCLERIKGAGLQIRFRSRPECDLASVQTALQTRS